MKKQSYFNFFSDTQKYSSLGTLNGMVSRASTSSSSTTTPIIDPTFSVSGGRWPIGADNRFLFPPTNLYPAIDEIGVVSDGATTFTAIARIGMPSSTTNLLDNMTVWARRLDSFDYHAEIVINSDLSVRASVSQDLSNWAIIDTVANTLEVSRDYTIVLVFNGALASNAARIRLFITNDMGQLIEPSSTYSGSDVTSLSTPLFCGWTLGAVYTGETTVSRTLRDVTISDVYLWSGLAGTGLNLVQAAYAADPTDFLGAVTEHIICGGSTATTEVFGGTAQQFGTAPTTDTLNLSGFRRYPASFIETLSEPGRSVLQNPQGAGTSPFSIVPSTIGAYTETGMNIYTLGTGVESPDPNAFVLVSGTDSSEPAGLFGDVAGNVISGPAGFIVHAIASVDVNTLGTRGTINALARAFGVGFEPSGLVGLGYVFDSTSAVADGWQRMVGNTLTPLGSAAPRDGREYGVLMVLRAGETDAYMALIDRSDVDNPVLVEEGTYPYPFAANTDAWIEANASPTSTSGGPIRRNRISVIEGCLAYS